MCKCDEAKKPINDRQWRIVMYRHHHTRQNGTTSARPISSNHSYLKCLACGAYWRTSAKYVEKLPGAKLCICYGAPQGIRNLSAQQARQADAQDSPLSGVGSGTLEQN